MDPEGTFQWYDFGAGWVSGVCGLLVGHPLDTIKVKQQTTGNRGAGQVLFAVLKQEGPFGLYKGLLMPLVTAGVLNSIFFGCYGNMVRLFAYLRDERPKRTCCDSIHNWPTYKGFHSDIFCAGAIGGAVTTLVACPFELAKIKLQVQYEQPKNSVMYSGSYDCLVKLFKAGGLKYVYKGLVPMLWRDVPTYAVYTLVYEHSLCVCEYNTAYHMNAPFCIVTGGCLAGVVSWALIVPIDVVKSRIQADDHRNPKYKGMIDCFRKTHIEGGKMIFTTGFSMTMLRAIPVNAAVFLGYETFISLYFQYLQPNL